MKCQREEEILPGAGLEPRIWLHSACVLKTSHDYVGGKFKIIEDKIKLTR